MSAPEPGPSAIEPEASPPISERGPAGGTTPQATTSERGVRVEGRREDRFAGRREEPGEHPTVNALGAPGDTLHLAPRFVARHQLLAQLPAFMFLAAWGGALFGGVVHIVLGLGGRGMPGWVPFVGAGLALAVALPAVSLWILRRAYRGTSYVVREGRLTYDEGFVALERRTLELSEVTLVRLRRGWLQKRHGLGTLILTVEARTGRTTPPPIELRDIAESELACGQMRELVAGLGAGAASLAGAGSDVGRRVA